MTRENERLQNIIGGAVLKACQSSVDFKLVNAQSALATVTDVKSRRMLTAASPTIQPTIDGALCAPAGPVWIGRWPRSGNTHVAEGKHSPVRIVFSASQGK